MNLIATGNWTGQSYTYTVWDSLLVNTMELNVPPPQKKKNKKTKQKKQVYFQ